MIEASIASAATGTAKVQRVTAGFTAITASTDTLKGLVEQIATASREQMNGISQVSTAVTQMEKVTQTTAAAAEESAAASEELDAQAQASTAIVRRVARLVMGARQMTGRRPASSEPRTRAAAGARASGFHLAA